MAFDDLSISGREVVVSIAKRFVTGKYASHFTIMTQLMGSGPLISLFYEDGEFAENIEVSENVIEALKTRQYITTLTCDERHPNYFKGSLTPKSYDQYNALLSPCDFTELIDDTKLAELIAYRWEESARAFDAGAYLSTIILLGSILEGVLLDRVRRSPSEANQVSSTPKDKEGKPLSQDKWSLSDLIAVCYQCGWIRKDRNDFAVVLRDYRNLVHPREQVKAHVYPDDKTCDVARQVTNAVLRDISESLKPIMEK